MHCGRGLQAFFKKVPTPNLIGRKAFVDGGFRGVRRWLNS